MDQKIAHYREIAVKVPDAQLAEGLAKLIAEVEAEKARLHPEKKERGSQLCPVVDFSTQTALAKTPSVTGLFHFKTGILVVFGKPIFGH